MRKIKTKVKPSEIILGHFISCGIRQPLKYIADDFEVHERTIRRYLKILDSDIDLLRWDYVEKIKELSVKVFQERTDKNTVLELFKGKAR